MRNDPPKRDERFSIEGDPEDALRGLLNADPDTQKLDAALERLRTASPEELATPGHRDALVTGARMAGADLDQIKAALEAPR
jgi:hypothetical protein